MRNLKNKNHNCNVAFITRERLDFKIGDTVSVVTWYRDVPISGFVLKPFIQTKRGGVLGVVVTGLIGVGRKLLSDSFQPVIVSTKMVLTEKTFQKTDELEFITFKNNQWKQQQPTRTT